MKKILIFFVLFVYTQGHAMDKNKNQNDFLHKDKFFNPLFSNLTQINNTMHETTLIISKKKLFMCRVCELIFYEKQLADLHGSQCLYCKGNVPRCALEAHQSVCRHNIQQ